MAGRGRGFTPYGKTNGSDSNERGMTNFDEKPNNDDGFKPTSSYGDDDGFKPTKSYGDDDGFKPTKSYDNNDDDGGFRPRNNFDGDRRGGGGRGGRGGGGFRRNDDRNGDDNDGGFRPRNNYDGDRRGGGGRGGRGGGGFRRNDDRNGDDNDGDSGFRSSNFDGERRGRGGRGGRGGGGFRRNDDDSGGYKSYNRDGDDNNDDGYKSSNFDDDNGGRGRGRGGRGGGRGRGRGGRDGGFNRDGDDFNGDGDDRRGGGGGGGRRNFDGDGDDGEKKEFINKEIYIPPEPEQDEEKMFASGITAGIDFEKRNKEVKVKFSENVPPPINTFEDAKLRSHLLDNIKKCKYTMPSPIQRYGIPTVLKGLDVMACAQTGSGKTAAFVLPIIHKLLAEPAELMSGDHCEPQCLVIAPTRELVIQIGEEFRKFANQSILKVETAYGGTAVGYQAKRLLNGCHIVVGTSGRLNDYINRGRIQLNSLRFFVLDEADRMLDEGFMKDVEKIVDHETMVPKEQRQTLMFSATFPDSIQKLASRFLRDSYGFIAVGIIGGANTDVDQQFYEVSGRDKKSKLMEILTREKENNTLKGTIVFVETKKTADFLAAWLSENDFPTTSMHGDRTQSQREKALSDIKYQSMDILVATNVAARGLDIKGVSHVIQFDISSDIDCHVHRIGRTGRVGNKGRSTTFYNPEKDSAMAGPLAKILKEAGQPVPDFLEGAGGGGDYQPGRSSNFGAQDFRNKGGNSDFNAAPNEPEDDW